MYSLIPAAIFAGAGYVVPLWQGIQQHHGMHSNTRPSAKLASRIPHGADAEYFLALDKATYDFLTRPAPARSWRWPEYVASVSDVLRVTCDGFDLVTRFVGKFGDSPIYALMRDGVISPPGIVKQPAAHDARKNYFGHFMKLPDGTLLYKRKAGA
jgi:hypothetical protein